MSNTTESFILFVYVNTTESFLYYFLLRAPMTPEERKRAVIGEFSDGYRISSQLVNCNQNRFFIKS